MFNRVPFLVSVPRNDRCSTDARTTTATTTTRTRMRISSGRRGEFRWVGGRYRGGRGRGGRENAREPIVRAREGEGEGRKATVGLISQGYIWNLMEAEFCRPPSVLCTQADFSRGLAYKSI